MNGVRNRRLLIFAVVLESSKALSQMINVIPISNKPTYAVPKIPSIDGIFMPENKRFAIRIKIKPNEKFRKSFATTSLSSLIL